MALYDLLQHNLLLNGVNKIKRDIQSTLEEQHVKIDNIYPFRAYKDFIPKINDTVLLEECKVINKVNRGDRVEVYQSSGAGTAVGNSVIMNAPDYAPSGPGIGCALSKDGNYLAVIHSGTSSPAYLVTYKLSVSNNRYQKTNNPDYLPSSLPKKTAISRYGDFLAVSQTNSPYLITYKWNEGNNRYEKTNDVLNGPGSNNFILVMSYDGMMLGLVFENNTIQYYSWEEQNQRYVRMNNLPPMEFQIYVASEVLLDGADATFNSKFVAYSNKGIPEYEKIRLYLWDDVNKVYNQISSPSVLPSGNTFDISLSLDGKYMAVVHNGSSSIPYLVTYTNSLGSGYVLYSLSNFGSISSNAEHIGFILDKDGEAEDRVKVVSVWRRN